MLDLDLLEKQLDEVLSKETSETLSSWLKERRLKNSISRISVVLGDGELISANKIEGSFVQSKVNKGQDFTQDYICPDFDYLPAAA